MSCFPYIRNSNFSQNVKDRMHLLHTDIYNSLKSTKGIKRHSDGFLYIPAQQSNEYRANAISSIAQFNKERKLITLVNRSVDNKIYETVKIDVTPIGEQYSNEDKFFQVNNNVDYTLKAVSLLRSPEGYNIFQKGAKHNWNLDKILNELKVPSGQIALVKEVFSKMPYYDNVPLNEQIALELISSYGYTVEINTAKKNIVDFNDPESYDDFYGTSPEEREQLIESKGKTNTQYYSNLTVPGGTNGSYIEANIETPLIKVPQSHAQFNTENTIGFSRNDDRQIYTEKDVNSLLEVMQKSGILKIKC